MTRRRIDSDDFPLTIDQQLADYLRGTLHLELYRSRLAKYLLPLPGRTAAEAREQIAAARRHEMTVTGL